MKDVTRILMLSLCAALCLSSCNKSHHAPDDSDQKIPIGFSAVSQTNMLKSGATTPLSSHHQDFAVWGIARMGGQADYVLWESDAMTAVSRSGESNNYIPTQDAYWLSGYTYNFLAIAPYTDLGATVTPVPATETSKDALTFTYDLVAKYALSDYDFDLMAAAAETEVTSSRTDSQELTFWHLFSKININISFVDDSNNPATGSVSQMLLRNVGSAAAYTITSDNSGVLSVACGTPSQTTDLSFSGSSAAIHILPQKISGFEMYLDFTQGEGEGAISTTDFKVNLASAKEHPDYLYNQQYNWNITIGPKAAISFSVSVVPWSHNSENDFDYDII